MVLVFDGARRWSGGTVAGAVYESREILDPDREHPWGVDGTYLGPLYAGSLDAYLASQESEDSRMLRLGRERVLGSDTEVVARSRAGSAPGEWFIREWIDPERMLVLKFEARLPDSDGLVVAATATLAYGQTQHPDLIEWRADPGAVELTCKSFLPSSPMDLPTPFLPVPAGALAGRNAARYRISLQPQPPECRNLPRQMPRRARRQSKITGGLLLNRRSDEAGEYVVLG